MFLLSSRQFRWLLCPYGIRPAFIFMEINGHNDMISENDVG